MSWLVNSSRREFTTLYDIIAELIGFYLIQLEKRHKWNLSDDDIFITYCPQQISTFAQLFDINPCNGIGGSIVDENL